MEVCGLLIVWLVVEITITPFDLDQEQIELIKNQMESALTSTIVEVVPGNHVDTNMNACSAVTSMAESTAEGSSNFKFNYVPIMASTPIDPKRLSVVLQGYCKRDYLVKCFQKGFSIDYNGPLYDHADNCPNTDPKDAVLIDSLIEAEIAANRVDGPFSEIPFYEYRCSPTFTVPKKELGSFRLILNLSYPKNEGLNAYINPIFTSVSYQGIDAVLEILVNMPSPVYLFKADLKSAFKLLPVQVSDLHLLCSKINKLYVVFKTLPMGYAGACKHCEDFSTALEWMVKKFSNEEFVCHYLDDFLGGHVLEHRSNFIYRVFEALCAFIGVPLALDKTVLPCTLIEYLGLLIDTVLRQLVVPKDKVLDALQRIDNVATKKKCTLKELQSLIGSLNFLCRAIRPGRAYLRRLVDATKGITVSHFYVSVTKEMKADLRMWKCFLTGFNGLVFWLPKAWDNNFDFEIFTDAAGKLGWGAICGTQWTFGKWSEKVVTDYEIPFKELFPIVLSCVLWGYKFKNRKVLFLCDNAAVVDIINKLSSTDPNIMILVRYLALITMKYNILFRGRHIEGVNNPISDSLSRLNLQKFRQLAPQADRMPLDIPPDFKMFCRD